jgi:hypothetical protein
MATGETVFDDVTFDLISVQYHSLKAGHDYGQYVRDARNAGKDDIADFFEQVMLEDSARAKKCHDFLAELGGTDNTSPSATSRSDSLLAGGTLRFRGIGVIAVDTSRIGDVVGPVTGRLLPGIWVIASAIEPREPGDCDSLRLQAEFGKAASE